MRMLEYLTGPNASEYWFIVLTGLAVAVYRIVVDEWALQDAIEEMDEFGFSQVWLDLRDYLSTVPTKKEENDLSQLQGELKRLRKANAQLELEVAILKKEQELGDAKRKKPLK